MSGAVVDCGDDLERPPSLNAASQLLVAAVLTVRNTWKEGSVCEIERENKRERMRMRENG